MTDTTNPQSYFDASARRFDEAAAALGQFREQIEALENLKSQHAKASETFNEANATLHAAIEALSPVGKLGTELLAALKETITATEAVINQYDQNVIAGIRDDVAALDNKVDLQLSGLRKAGDQAGKELQNVITAIRDDITALSKRVELQLNDSRKERDQARKALEGMQTKVKALPLRIRRKYSLD